MPVIVFASPKGGVGKSTSALLLAQELAHHGASVAMLDADANEPIISWARAASCPPNLRVFGQITEDSILDIIDRERVSVQFVIVDLEGTKNLKVARAIGRANLVIIPMTGSHLDAASGVAAIRLVRTEERAFERKIPHAVLFTRTSPAIVTRDQAAARAQLKEAGVPVLEASLDDRAAFRAIFAYGQTLRGLDEKEVRNIPAAIANAEEYASEVIKILRS